MIDDPPGAGLDVIQPRALTDEVMLPPELRFRLEQRAAALGFFDAQGQPRIGGLLGYRMAELRRRGLSPRDAFDAMSDPEDPDLAALHTAIVRLSSARQKSWRSGPAIVQWPAPDIMARLQARAAAAHLSTSVALVDEALLGMTNRRRPTSADIRTFLGATRTDDPDLHALAVALTKAEPARAPANAIRH